MSPAQLKNDLKKAIQNGDLEKVQEILTIRDENGVPHVGINDGFSRFGSALMYALNENPVNEQIIQALVNVRDKQNNLVININHRLYFGQTVFSYLLNPNINRYIKLEQRRRLLQNFLGLLDAEGKVLADLAMANKSNDVKCSLLRLALDTNDAVIMRMLLSFRNKEGKPALNVNEITHESTVLDFALKGRGYAFEQPINEEVILEIRRAGGHTLKELYEEKRRNKPLKTATNLNWANTALRFVKWTCVYGAQNRQEDREKTNNFVDKLMKESRDSLMNILKTEYELYSKSLGLKSHLSVFSLRDPGFETYYNCEQNKLVHLAQHVMRYRAGNCDEQASLAIIFLLSQGVYNVCKLTVNTNDESGFLALFGLESKHTFVAIGLDEEYTNLNKPETIPEDAFIVDPWENVTYPAKEFITRAINFKYYGGKITYAFEKEGLKNFDTTDRKKFSEELQHFISEGMLCEDWGYKKFAVHPMKKEILQSATTFFQKQSESATSATECKNDSNLHSNEFEKHDFTKSSQI